jgi:hypothetical protein
MEASKKTAIIIVKWYVRMFYHQEYNKKSQACSMSCAGILEQSMGVRNRVGIGLSYRPARLAE